MLYFIFFIFSQPFKICIEYFNKYKSSENENESSSNINNEVNGGMNNSLYSKPQEQIDSEQTFNEMFFDSMQQNKVIKKADKITNTEILININNVDNNFIDTEKQSKWSQANIQDYNTITIGDLHGNILSLIHILFKLNIIKTTDGGQAYQKLLKQYYEYFKKFDLLMTLRMSENSKVPPLFDKSGIVYKPTILQHEPQSLKDKIWYITLISNALMKFCISLQKVEETTIQFIRLLGNVFGDRGVCDIHMFYLQQQISKICNIKFDPILGSHDLHMLLPLLLLKNKMRKDDEYYDREFSDTCMTMYLSSIAFLVHNNNNTYYAKYYYEDDVFHKIFDSIDWTDKKNENDMILINDFKTIYKQYQEWITNYYFKKVRAIVVLNNIKKQTKTVFTHAPLNNLNVINLFQIFGISSTVNRRTFFDEDISWLKFFYEINSKELFFLLFLLSKQYNYFRLNYQDNNTIFSSTEYHFQENIINVHGHTNTEESNNTNEICLYNEFGKSWKDYKHSKEIPVYLTMEQ